ncbi:CoA transferase [Bacillus aerolatus]|uniref:CoA transferase n=1 Tax=Bacillus aerolatus TaxID=2653354 RepID=A0A6I1FJW6_9BACI|nr:CaiB/BaiF CoA-transferase family protein [Bacillus aerolatus]KAB7709009.1 CoA transferase [Bacillus aerolatus]
MLEGIKIIDFSNYLPGPFAAMRLGDLGAEIIKIESPSGDPARRVEKAIYLANNRNKKSVVLNLKEEAARESALKLISEADVVIESFRPGVMKRLGLDYDTVKRVKPDIIYCSISGYGQSGTFSILGSHDLNYMALSGVLSQLKDKEGKPVHPTMTFADLIGSLAANESILAALIARQKTGEGCFLDLSLTDALTAFMANHLVIEKMSGYEHGVKALSGEIISYCLYETKDGRYMSLAALELNFWKNFCAAVNKEEWVSAHTSKTTDDNEVYEDIVKLFQSRTFQEWTAFSEKIDCCMAPVLETSELAENCYMKEREMVTEKWGLPFVKTQVKPTLEEASKPPKKGEHTAEVLAGHPMMFSNK